MGDTSLIYVRYIDVHLPSRGGGYFTCKRVVHNIQSIEKGEQGIIRYSGKDIAVYRRKNELGNSWNTNKSVLEPIKAVYLSRG
jgi:hypothetical protein